MAAVHDFDETAERRAAPREIYRRLRSSPLVFVVAALLLLLVIPLAAQFYIGEKREKDREVARPAVRLVDDLQVELAREISWMLQFHVAENERYRRAYWTARRREDLVLDRLEPRARALGPRVYEQFERLRRRLDDWHATVLELNLLGRQVDPTVFLQRLSDAYVPFDEAAAAGRALSTLVQRRSAEITEEVERAERIRNIVTAVLVVIALAAAVVVARLGRRLARVTAESERRRFQAERRQHELERLTESRERLMRGFSHDVKNPLGAADGQLQLLEQGVVDGLGPRQKESVGRARHAIGTALTLIDDVLELARLEVGRIEFERTRTDLRDAARDSTVDYQGQARGKRLELIVDLPSEPVEIVSDPTRVRQILGNLVANAIKYTPEDGHVTIRAALREAGGDGARGDLPGPAPAPAPGPGRWGAVDVSDDGPGVPEQSQSILFDEFQRLDERPGAGAGLGLAISRRLARGLDGDITIASEVGVGSTFTLWLPAPVEPTSRADAGTGVADLHRRVGGPTPGPPAATNNDA